MGNLRNKSDTRDTQWIPAAMGKSDPDDTSQGRVDPGAGQTHQVRPASAQRWVSIDKTDPVSFYRMVSTSLIIL